MEFTLNKLDKFVNNLTTIDEKMKELKWKLEGLNALKEDLESRRSTELQHPRKKLKAEVELWFRNVERINGEILELEQKIGDSNAVSRGWGSLTEQESKKTIEVEELLQQSKKFQDSLVVDNLGWIGQALSTTSLFGETAEICMKKIWAYLMDADVQKIGVWGMGGIGKTTIVKLIHNKLLEEREKFNIVIWITVSKEMNIFNLQNKIARAMHKTLDEDEDETTRAGKIYEWLQARTGKYVLILDDLWDKLCLEDVGIPEPSNGSKLLVTTRLLDVCCYLDCQQIKVPTLSKPDAWSLFSEKVGQKVLRHPDLLPIVKSVAEECDGLPLAIVTIASSMKGVCNVHEWRNAVHELSRHEKCVNDEIEEKVFRKLQFSYDRLRDEKAKHCFLCCALYPEDHPIGKDELIELWIAEGLVEEMDSMQNEIDRGHTILNKLKNSCLIEKLSTIHVKVHDVVRDMALRITGVRPRFLVRAGMHLKMIPDLQHWKEDLEKVSLMMNWSLQIPHQMPAPKCPNLTTLLLSDCGIHSIPEGFFDQMKGLKILDLCGNDAIESLPNSISNLETLTTLLLGGCISLENVPSFSKLKALKKLDLSNTKIEDIPDGMEKLVNLKYLDLSITRIREMDDGILTKLASLQWLNLIGFDGITNGIQVRGEVIGGLRKLERLDVRFDDLNELNSYTQALLDRNIWPREYRIYVGLSAQVGYEYYLNDGRDKWMHIDGGDAICICCINKIPSDVQKLSIKNFCVGLCEEEVEEVLMLSMFIIPVPLPLNNFFSLSKVEIENCQKIKKLFSSNWVLHNLQNLEYLWVEECYDIEEIIASELELEMEMEEGITSSTTTSSASGSFKFSTTLPKLKILELRDLPELKSICGPNRVMVCDSIEQIRIKDCPELKRMGLNLPLKDDGQPYPPPPLTEIQISSRKWSQLEWDHPNAKSLLEPYLKEW